MLKIELNPQKVAEIYKVGLTTDSYYVLNCILQDKNNTLFCDIAHLVKEGWVSQSQVLTAKSVQLIEKLENSEVKKTDWEEIYFLLQNTMIKLTNKKQKMIQGKYSFLPNQADLTSKLTKVITKYDLKDLNLLKKCLVRHIENSHKANWQMVTLMTYFILKDGNSQLVTMYENWSDIEEAKKQEFDGVNI